MQAIPQGRWWEKQLETVNITSLRELMGEQQVVLVD